MTTLLLRPSHWRRSSPSALPTPARTGPAGIGAAAEPAGAAPAPGAGRDVRIEGISLAYRDTAALRGVDLQVRSGELLALLGPSGSGKTTLLRVIAGLETPDRGRVFFGGEDVTDLAVQERGIGFVFQHYALFRHLRVSDNIAYGLRARRRGRPPEAAIRARVSDLLDLVQLSGLGDRFPSQLSGGQRQRVALARALATEPRVLLLDEPFGALDARVRKDLRRWLREIHRETGQTTIFVTHDQDEALELSDRVAILDRGRLEQVGSPLDVHDSPASAFVAGFVGDRLRIPVSVARGRVWLGSRALALPSGEMPDGEAALFVHPDEIALVEPGLDAIPGMVSDVRRIGRRGRVNVRLLDVAMEIEVDSPSALPDVGARVGLAVSAERVFRTAPR